MQLCQRRVGLKLDWQWGFYSGPETGSERSPNPTKSRPSLGVNYVTCETSTRTMTVWKSLINRPAEKTTVREKTPFSYKTSPGVYGLGLAFSIDNFDFYTLGSRLPHSIRVQMGT
jgi:hypothetical protein